MRQPRTIAIAYNVWEVPWKNLKQTLKMGFLCLVLGIFIKSLCLMEGTLSTHGNLLFNLQMYTQTYMYYSSL